jgi:hypothetical protein
MCRASRDSDGPGGYYAKTCAPSETGSRGIKHPIYARSGGGQSVMSASTSLSESTAPPQQIANFMFPAGQTRVWNGITVRSLHVDDLPPGEDPNDPNRAAPSNVEYLGHTPDDTLSLMGVRASRGDYEQRHFYSRQATTGPRATQAALRQDTNGGQQRLLPPIPERQQSRVASWRDGISNQAPSQYLEGYSIATGQDTVHPRDSASHITPQRYRDQDNCRSSSFSYRYDQTAQGWQYVSAHEIGPNVKTCNNQILGVADQAPVNPILLMSLSIPSEELLYALERSNDSHQ